MGPSKNAYFEDVFKMATKFKKDLQEKPRWAQEGHQERQRAFSTTLKKQRFLHVFGSRGLPRKPQEAREGSQETPKETPKGGPKIGQKVVKKCTQKWAKKASSALIISLKVALTACNFQKLGFLKTLTWRCLKDSLKMLPKWFQNGSRLPKVLKIAPKIRPYKDL